MELAKQYAEKRAKINSWSIELWNENAKNALKSNESDKAEEAFWTTIELCENNNLD